MAKKDKEKEGEAEEKDEKKGADAKEEKEEKKEGEEGEAGEGAEGEAAPKKSKKKIIILGVLALVVILGGAAGAYFAGLFGKKEAQETAEVGPDGKPIEKPIFYTLPEFLVNLNAGGKQTSFLKTTVILEVPHQEDVTLIEANLPRLQDAFNTYLRELRASDLAGSSGIQRLREELLLRANKALSPIKVNDVLFKEIIVQ